MGGGLVSTLACRCSSSTFFLLYSTSLVRPARCKQHSTALLSRARRDPCHIRMHQSVCMGDQSADHDAHLEVLIEVFKGALLRREQVLQVLIQARLHPSFQLSAAAASLNVHITSAIK